MKVSDLKPLEKNPFKSKGDAQIKRIAKSIQEFERMMEIRRIVIDEDNNILGGNKRYFALKKLGYKEIPDAWIEKVEGLTEEQKKEFIVKDNAHWGSEWDYKLLEEWKVDLNAWGVGDIQFGDGKEVKEDNYEIPDEIQTDIVLGDLFEIGEHRLLCGDSTDSEQVSKLMNGKKADMVFTDPPYKIQTEGGCKGAMGKSLRKQGQDIEFISNFNPIDFLNLLPFIFEKNKLNSYIFCNKELLPDYLIWARDNGYSFNVLIWKKPNAIPIGDSHRPDIEYLLLFRKSAIWNNGLKDVNYSRCLEFGRESGLHPTMKPIELIANEMKISSNEKSLVFDFFLGSGSTMVASHQLNRKCYGMEIEPKYCQIIIDRMRNLDPNLVIKKNGIEI